MQVTKDVFEAAAGRLKVVGRAGVGVDNVDLSSATEVRQAELLHGKKGGPSGLQKGTRSCDDSVNTSRYGHLSCGVDVIFTWESL